MSYLRKVLEVVEGFDENILHYFDDVETCLQVIDHGYLVHPLPNAVVHHKYLPSHIRNHSRIMLDPYRYVCDCAYFSLKYGRVAHSIHELEQSLVQKTAYMKAEAAQHVAMNRLTQDQYAYYVRRLSDAVEMGISKGLNLERAGRPIPPANPTTFLPCPEEIVGQDRLKLCWIGTADQIKPDELSTLAKMGHEVHVVTPSTDGNYQVDIDDGVWLHRISGLDRWCPEMEGRADELVLKRIAATYHEVCKIQATGSIDLICTPADDRLSTLCRYDDRFQVIQWPVAVAGAAQNLEAELRGVIRSHQSGTSRPTPDSNPQATVTKEWAKSLGISKGAAQRLLNPARYPTDYTALVRRLWDLPPQDCLRGLYELLLGRLPADQEVQHWLAVAQETSMVDVVSQLSSCLEASKREIPTDWVREVILAVRYREPGTHVPISHFRRIRNYLMRVPVLGKGIKSCRRLVGYLWNVHKQFAYLSNSAGLRRRS